MNVESLSAALRFDRDAGLWRAVTTRAVAYPADDHAACFGVEDASFWFRHRNRCIAAAVRRFEPAGFILDVGGGNGYVSRGLIDAGCEAVLLEPGPTGARNARESRGLPDVICATLEDAAIVPGSVPAVGLFDVLEHIEDDRAFVARLHEMLRPGGWLYLTVPAFTSLWSMSDVDAMHFRRYTRATLTRVLAGRFEVAYATYLFGRLTPLFFLSRTLPYRLGITKARSARAYETEHAAGGSRMAALVERALAHEVAAIAAGRSLAMGSSLLVVARRVDQARNA